MSDTGIMYIDELQHRLDDPDATFTTAEVLKLIEWTERNTAKDIYNQARVASIMQSASQIAEDSHAMMTRLLDIREAEGRTHAPTYQVVQI